MISLRESEEFLSGLSSSVEQAQRSRRDRTDAFGVLSVVAGRGSVERAKRCTRTRRGDCRCRSQRTRRPKWRGSGSNENFAFQAVAELRMLGHDIVTSYDAEETRTWAAAPSEVLARSLRLSGESVDL